MNANRTLFRRTFLFGAGSAALLASSARPTSQAHAQEPNPNASDDPWLGLKVGIASYTYNRLPLEAAIKGIQRVGVEFVSIKDAHLPMKSTPEERKTVARAFRDAKITPLSCGVVTMNDNESDIRNAFEYARDAGIPTIVCKPTRASLPVLDAMVKEFGIKLAIHNHGPEDNVWPSPLDVWEAVQKHDERIGICVDVDHTARCGVDPIRAIRTCAPRLYDLHMKDIASKQDNSRPVEVGRGVLDIRGMLKALLEIR